MIAWFLVVVLLVALIAACYYLIKFARIILGIEEDLTDALEVFESTHRSLENVLKMKLFYDSREVKAAVGTALENVKISQIAITTVIKNFTRLSKQKYILVRINNANESQNDIDQGEDRYQEEEAS